MNSGQIIYFPNFACFAITRPEGLRGSSPFAIRNEKSAEFLTKVVLHHDLGFGTSLGIWSLGTWVFQDGAPVLCSFGEGGEFLTKTVRPFHGTQNLTLYHCATPILRFSTKILPNNSA